MRLTRIGVVVMGLLGLSAAAGAQTPNPGVGRKVWITMADASVHQVLGAAMGGAAGAIVGGLLDAANPGRQVIFERTSVNIAPVVTGRSRSVTFVVRW